MNRPLHGFPVSTSFLTGLPSQMVQPAQLLVNIYPKHRGRLPGKFKAQVYLAINK